jgi:Tfp pilus assembly protein PilO
MKLSKQKRNHLILVALVTAGVLGALWFGLIGLQKESLKKVAERNSSAVSRLEEMKRAIKSADAIENELAEEWRKLETSEKQMASGDLYSWSINTIRTFKLPYKIEIPQFSQIDGPKDLNLLPKFPYQQASISIGGTGQFHEVGRFIADFENAFPHSRISNINLEPVPGLQATEQEQLLFKMDIVFLVKPTGA